MYLVYLGTVPYCNANPKKVPKNNDVKFFIVLRAGIKNLSLAFSQSNSANNFPEHSWPTFLQDPLVTSFLYW